MEMDLDIVSRRKGLSKDKLIHATASIHVDSIVDAPGKERPITEEPESTVESGSTLEDAADQKRAREMQMWFDEAITRNMDLPEGYLKVAVLLVKWDDQLDEMKTRPETLELEAVFRDQFHFHTEIAELRGSPKPQHQLNSYLYDFVKKHDGPHNLLIVYYTGHGAYLEDEQYLELSASKNPMLESRLRKEARCNWNRAEDILRYDVECDVLTIMDTCFSSNHIKSGKREDRTFETLSACSINRTTAGPGDKSFTRALIKALKELHDEFKDRPFTTLRLNQRILLDEHRSDTPSQLWFRLQHHHERHIRLAPLLPGQDLAQKSSGLRVSPRGYLTLCFALRDETLNQEQIEYLSMKLAKAFNKKAMIRRVDWVDYRRAKSTYFGGAMLAMRAIAQWKRILQKGREQRASQVSIDEDLGSPTKSVAASPIPSPTRKRTRDGFDNVREPERKRGNLVIPQPPSPPVSDISLFDDREAEVVDE